MTDASQTGIELEKVMVFLTMAFLFSALLHSPLSMIKNSLSIYLEGALLHTPAHMHNKITRIKQNIYVIYTERASSVLASISNK